MCSFLSRTLAQKSHIFPLHGPLTITQNAAIRQPQKSWNLRSPAYLKGCLTGCHYLILDIDHPITIEELAVIIDMQDDSKSSNIGPKIRKEKETVEKMIRLYCEKKHSPASGTLCSECQNLLEYAHLRLEKCQYQEDKPTCRKCPVHCYKLTMREEIRQVMRFSGPRLALRAPMDWIRHQIHDRDDSESEKDV